MGIAFVPVSIAAQNISKEITRKELIAKSTIKDTVVEYTYHSNGKIKFKGIYSSINTTLEDGFSSLLGYIKEEEYRSDGILKGEYFYDQGLLLKVIEYDTKGNLSYQYIYEYDNPDDLILTMGTKYLKSKNSTTYTWLSYYRGKLILRAYFLKGKKHGLWEYYNNWSGILTKKITWKEGKKVHVEKIETKAE